MTKKLENVKPYEISINDRGQLDIIDHIESQKRDAICIYNDLGVPPFSSAKAICDLLNNKEERIKELEKENKELYFILKQHEFAKKEGYELEKEIKYKIEAKNAWKERFR